jgi:competence protein ComEC
MNINLFVFGLCFFKMTVAYTPHHISSMLIRNVGQGQWITHIRNDSCDHYDFGGEMINAYNHKKQFINDCSNKINRLYLSHAHVDHYAFISLIIKNSKSTCWQLVPLDEMNRQTLPYCDEPNDIASIIYTGWDGKTKNDRSTVLSVNKFLLPGDASSKKEKEWVKRSNLKEIEYLVLGHHGSQTSTSIELLRHLPRLKMTIASARYKRYRHPSFKTVSKIKMHKIPLIKTEDWGNLKIE